MIAIQRIYPMAVCAILGAYLYGLNGLIIGGIIGYGLGIIIPWRL